MSDILKMLEGFDAGKVLALFNRLGGRANVDALLRGDLMVEFMPVIHALIDQHGRCIPPKGMKGVVDANRDFKVVESEDSFLTTHDRLVASFPTGTSFVHLAGFAEQSSRLITKVRTNPWVANFLNGPWTSVCLPQIAEGDYGTLLEEFFLPAVERTYQQAFPDRTFKSWRKGEFANKVTVVDERHAKLVERMKQEPLVGLYFPVALQGFGIEAARQMVTHLPEGFSLSGPFDTATAIVADTQPLCRDFQTPGYDCAAVSWQGPSSSLGFKANVARLDFDHGSLGARGGCSAGLLFVG